eukprot:scpid57725/ scgid12230/ 
MRRSRQAASGLVLLCCERCVSLCLGTSHKQERSGEHTEHDMRQAPPLRVRHAVSYNAGAGTPLNNYLSVFSRAAGEIGQLAIPATPHLTGSLPPLSTSVAAAARSYSKPTETTVSLVASR